MSAGSRDPDTDAPRASPDWCRVADGVFLAGLGVFFLLATTRGLPEGFWVEAVSFWPVLLVSAGIRIVFDKTALAFAVVLGPLVVLATLFWIAWGDDRPELPPPGEWHALRAEAPDGVDRARVFAKLAGVQVNVVTRPLAPGLIAEGRAASRAGKTQLRVSDGDGEATLRLQGRRGGFMVIGMRREVWDLGVTDRLPLSVDLNGAFIRGDFDLRQGQVRYAEVDGAFNSATFRLPPPTETVTIRLKGAFSTFDVVVPEGTPVRYQGPGFPISYVNKAPGSGSFPEDGPGYKVIVEGAFTVLDIEEGPAPDGGWPARPLPIEASEAARPAGQAPLAEDPSGAAAPPPEAAPRLPAEDPDGATSS